MDDEQQVLDVIARDEHSVGLLKAVMTRGNEILESDVISVLTWRDGKVCRRANRLRRPVRR